MEFTTCHGDQSDNSAVLENRRIRRQNPVKEAFTSKISDHVEDDPQETDSAATCAKPRPSLFTLRSLTPETNKQTKRAVLVQKYKWVAGF